MIPVRFMLHGNYLGTKDVPSLFMPMTKYLSWLYYSRTFTPKSEVGMVKLGGTGLFVHSIDQKSQVINVAHTWLKSVLPNV